MLPFLRAGDAVRVTGARPRLGDLVAFWEQGQVIVHRCAGWTRGPEPALRQKGDNLAGCSCIPAPRIIGRVDRCRRAGSDLGLEEGWGFWWNRALGFRAWASCALGSLAAAARGRRG